MPASNVIAVATFCFLLMIMKRGCMRRFRVCVVGLLELNA